MCLSHEINSTICPTILTCKVKTYLEFYYSIIYTANEGHHSVDWNSFGNCIYLDEKKLHSETKLKWDYWDGLLSKKICQTAPSSKVTVITKNTNFFNLLILFVVRLKKINNDTLLFFANLTNLYYLLSI